MQRKTVKMMVSGMAQWYAVARQKRTAEATVRVENLIFSVKDIQTNAKDCQNFWFEKITDKHVGISVILCNFAPVPRVKKTRINTRTSLTTGIFVTIGKDSSYTKTKKGA